MSVSKENKIKFCQKFPEQCKGVEGSGWFSTGLLQGPRGGVTETQKGCYRDPEGLLQRPRGGVTEAKRGGVFSTTTMIHLGPAGRPSDDDDDSDGDDGDDGDDRGVV